MIICVRRGDKVTHYFEGFQRHGDTLYFVIQRDSYQFLSKLLPVEGTLMTEEQFEEQFYVPEN